MVDEQKWSNDQFDQVDWRNLHKTLNNKTDSYQTWLAKQHSGCCGARKIVAHHSGISEADVSCLNCGQIEKVEHLCVCPCENRPRLLNENAEELGAWLFADGRTEPQIAYWVPKFIMYGGNVTFAEMGDMSPEILVLARSQDLNKRRNFMEGRILKYFCEIQSYYLADAQSYKNGHDWTKAFISKILQITHS